MKFPLFRIVQVLKLLFIYPSFPYFSLHLCIKMLVTPSSFILSSYIKRHLSEKIPTAQLLICLFHVLQTFKRKITCEKMAITAAQQMSVLENISKLVYAQDQQNYHVHYQQLKETKLMSVVEYYDQNWRDIRSQWVEGLKHDYAII